MTNQFSQSSPAQHTEDKDPSSWKKIIAWIGVVCGGLATITSPGQDGARGTFSSILFGLAILIPSAWFLLHERREANGAEPLKRHWRWVWAVAILLFFLMVLVAPNPENPPLESPSTSESSTSSSAPTPMETTSAEPSLSTSEPPALVEESAPHNQENPAIDQAPNEHEEHVLAPEEPLAPEPVYQQPAPVEIPPQPSGGGGSCAAIGHKVYRGDGLYSRKLDRDGDGVGCESYPG
ncbi:excalibur calcium-binding domain-containing protein [Corynebacterium macginleyi]|uniref:excalibur calcium-binding domain-containing protein n=1 Tax=Corynebacterium macginleyi TaxID=38290 RepID=UPI00398B6903